METTIGQTAGHKMMENHDSGRDSKKHETKIFKLFHKQNIT